MRRRSLVLALAAASVVAVPALVGAAAAERPELAPGTHPGASNGVVYQYARGQAPSRGGGSNRVLMTNHGGKVLHQSRTRTIFWGTGWNGYSGDKITGLDSWYSGFGGSTYAATGTEYSDASGPVGTSSTYSGHVMDYTKASGGQSTSAILAEVQRVVTAQGITPTPDDYYAVYTDLPRGNAGYCAWHSYGTVNGVGVQFAFFWNLDNDPGCDPQDGTSGHSPGLAALGNVTGHELLEAVTDPALNAWYDASGAENGDKCAWTFGSKLVTLGTSQWKIQGEWSNAAYTAGTGYPNNSGQRGCLPGS